MPQRRWRFLHTSDLHLETPVHGVTEVPESMRESFLQATYDAAEQITEIALSHQVEFVLLVGDVLQSSTAGPQGISFLLEQFERLAQRKIAVYWAGGQVDPPEEWPTAIDLPPNVHRFPTGRMEEFVHEIDSHPVARIMGLSWSARNRVHVDDFRPDPKGLFSIGAAYGPAPESALKRQRTDYLALGGNHQRSTPVSGSRIAHYPGSPQGRSPTETDAHGCSLVDVDDQGNVRMEFSSTEIMRWSRAQLDLEVTLREDKLSQQFVQHIKALRSEAPEIDHLVSWTVGGSGPVVERLRDDRRRSALLDELRRDYDMRSPGVWSVSLNVEGPTTVHSSWYEEDSILGEYLRRARQYETDAQLPLDLSDHLAERHRADTIGDLVQIAGKDPRERILKQATQLGAQLLAAGREETG